MLAAIQLSSEAIAAGPVLAGRHRCCRFENGVMTRSLATGALQISPPLIIDTSGLEEFADTNRVGTRSRHWADNGVHQAVPL